MNVMQKCGTCLLNSWFCGMDVATSLQYSNPSKAIIDHCKPTSITIQEVGVNISLPVLSKA